MILSKLIKHNITSDLTTGEEKGEYFQIPVDNNLLSRCVSLLSFYSLSLFFVVKCNELDVINGSHTSVTFKIACGSL
jgi:hypothetical protein